jgi:hypothetical protein
MSILLQRYPSRSILSYLNEIGYAVGNLELYRLFHEIAIQDDKDGVIYPRRKTQSVDYNEDTVVYLTDNLNAIRAKRVIRKVREDIKNLRPFEFAEGSDLEKLGQVIQILRQGCENLHPLKV